MDENFDPNLLEEAQQTLTSRADFSQNFDTLREAKDKFNEIKKVFENTLLTERRLQTSSIKSNKFKNRTTREQDLEFENKLSKFRMRTQKNISNWTVIKMEMNRNLMLNQDESQKEIKTLTMR